MPEPEPHDPDEFGVPVHIFQKNASQEYRVSLNEFKGHEYIDIRLFYDTPDGMRPGKGVTIPKKFFPDLIQGVFLLGEALGYDEEALTQMLAG